jgi:hypothetical protein
VASNGKTVESDLTTLRTYHLDDLEAVIPEELLRKVFANGMYHNRKISILLAARILIEDFREKKTMAMAAKIARSRAAKKVLSWNDGINVNALAKYRTWMIQQHAKAQAKAKAERPMRRLLVRTWWKMEARFRQRRKAQFLSSGTRG